MMTATRCLTLALGFLLLLSSPVQAELEDEVFYHFMPIAWRDSDGDTFRFGDFDGMAASLDYLSGLGVTAVWMNPIFPSPAYHGYQHGRADQLNTIFGSPSQWESFVQAAHARGIKVYVDFVAYGISHDSPWFQDAYANPASAYDDWLAFENSANTQYFGSNYTTWNGSPVGFIHWDLRDPGARQLVTDWATHWLDPDGDGLFDDGLDGYRLDHVWETYPNGPDGWGYHIDSFWTPWRDALRAVNPDVRVFGEQALWSSYGEDLFGGMDAAFTKPFEFAARDAFLTGDAAWLYNSVATTRAKQENAAVPGTFLATIGNHDVSRLATVIGDDFERGKAAAAVLMTQPYPPVIYYGDEIGMRGAKDGALGGDASDIPMREPFKWNAVEGPPMTAYHALHPAAWSNRISRDNDGRSVEEQEGVSGSLLEAYRQLVGIRRSSIALRRGDYHPVNNDQSSVWSFVRHDLNEQVLVLINLSSQATVAQLDLSAFDIPGGSTTPASLRGSGTLPALTASNRDAYPVPLGSYGYQIYQVSLDPPVAPVVDIDGQGLEGVVMAVQNNEVIPPLDNGFELDRLQVMREGDRLRIGLAGNMGNEIGGLCLFYDAVPGGQNTLQVTGIGNPPSGPEQLSGTRFDLGFEPEGFLYFNLFQGVLYVDQMFLQDGGGGSQIYRGSTVPGSGFPLLSGGNNLNQLQVGLDNSNVAGVDSLDVSGAIEVTTGLEVSVALADFGIDDQATELKLSAALLYWWGDLSNQWLPGLGGGVEFAGIGPDLRGFPGDQFVTIPIQGAPVAAPLGESNLRLVVAREAESTRFQFDLPTAGKAELALYDIRGRRVRLLLSERAEAGSHSLRWDGRSEAGAPVAAGIYFARLSHGGERTVARVVHLR